MNRSISLITLAIALVACSDKDVETPEAENVEEVITTVQLLFTPVGAGTPVSAQFSDADGPGGEAPTQTAIVLAANATYILSLELLNETLPMDDEGFVIGKEIEAECEEHQFFFAGSALDDGLIELAYADRESDYDCNLGAGDPADLPVGLLNTVEAASAGTGVFIVSLRHQPPLNGQPGKTATSGIEDGEEDLRISFDLEVR